jgi:hypothetical protein
MLASRGGAAARLLEAALARRGLSAAARRPPPRRARAAAAADAPPPPPPPAAAAPRGAPRRLERTGFECPACRGALRLATAATWARHVARCCPDLAHLLPAEPPAAARSAAADASVDPYCSASSSLDDASSSDADADAGADADADAPLAWLAAAAAAEDALRARALEAAFLRRGPEGARLRGGAPEVAAALGLPEARAARVLRAAMRAVPLASDPGPVSVIYEDADVVAFDKPPGLRTAPRHRWEGGSLVARAIGERRLWVRWVGWVGWGLCARSGCSGFYARDLNPNLALLCIFRATFSA